MNFEPIAYIHTDFPDKFGIPRQSGQIENLKGIISFKPEYRQIEAVRGLEDVDYLWLLWVFSGNKKDHWTATVRPPRLGGNVRMGVFATRSPYRPNPIGLSSVKLDKIDYDNGPILYVSGVDLLDGTPILDIKPYLPYCDSHPDARGGFTDRIEEHFLNVFYDDDCKKRLTEEELETLTSVLREDPRPRYQDDPERIYGMSFRKYNVHFKIHGKNLYVLEIS